MEIHFILGPSWWIFFCWKAPKWGWGKKRGRTKKKKRKTERRKQIIIIIIVSNNQNLLDFCLTNFSNKRTENPKLLNGVQQTKNSIRKHRRRNGKLLLAMLNFRPKHQKWPRICKHSFKIDKNKRIYWITCDKMNSQGRNGGTNI